MKLKNIMGFHSKIEFAQALFFKEKKTQGMESEKSVKLVNYGLTRIHIGLFYVN